ncbi:PH-like domain-containing protein [Myceligenerans cantabricum]
MPMPLAVAIWVVIGLVLLYLVLTGRRRLASRTRTLVPAPPKVPAEVSASLTGALATGPEPVFGPVEATYVSSTLHGDWLARVGAHQLGDRALARVSVLDSGVFVERDGTRDLWIPLASIRSAQLAPGMAGKYVGPDGLVVVSWAVSDDGAEAGSTPDAGPVLLDTGLRTRHATERGALVDAVRHLVATGRSGTREPTVSDPASSDSTTSDSTTSHDQGNAR